MCGIGGGLLPKGKRFEASWLQIINHHLIHRGPDDFGFQGWNGERELKAPSRELENISGDQLVLIHRRLSIVDPTSRGWQPFQDNQKKYAISFNGEIYNYLELREELRRLGHSFQSDTDTEVLLKCWQEWGYKTFQKIIGMYAFALIDLKQQTLIMARDPFGIKPLYWSEWKGGIVFASEIPALLHLPDMRKRLNPTAAYAFLNHAICDHTEETMIADIKKVPAGHCLEFDLNNATLKMKREIWVQNTSTAMIPEAEAVILVREKFIKSVEYHLRSDVPLALTLSGGIDSTSIMGCANHLGALDNISIFSFVSNVPSQSEEYWIDEVSKYYRIKVNKIRVEENELFKRLTQLTKIQGEPFATTGMFAQANIFKKIHEAGIKVSLDGQGADELLAGYPTFIVSRIADLLKQMNVKDARALLKEHKLHNFLRSIILILAPDFEQYIRDNRHFFGFSPLLNKNWFQDHDIKFFGSKKTCMRDFLHDHLDQTFYELSLPALLRYADRNAMACSVENRVPFLEPNFVRLTQSLPSSFLLDAKTGSKSIFRKAMQGLIPENILQRKDKIGFATPEEFWLKASPAWMRQKTRDTLELLPMVNKRAALAELEDIISGSKKSNSLFWRCLSMGVWAEQFNIQI